MAVGGDRDKMTAGRMCLQSRGAQCQGLVRSKRGWHRFHCADKHDASVVQFGTPTHQHSQHIGPSGLHQQEQEEQERARTGELWLTLSQVAASQTRCSLPSPVHSAKCEQHALGFRDTTAAVRGRLTQAGHAEEAHEVVHITLNGSRDTRVLYLHHHTPPVVQLRRVHLTNAGGCQRLEIKLRDTGLPVWPQLRHQHLLQLPARHDVSPCSHTLQSGLELRRQHIFVLYAQHLTQLQSCATHAAQRIGQPLGVVLCEPGAGGVGTEGGSGE